MGQPQVVATATMMCSFGLAPSVLNVLPINRVTVEGRPAANIMDHQPILNIPPFGMCTSLANPTVAAATAAALGTLTPMPCVPVTVAPWVPGSGAEIWAQVEPRQLSRTFTPAPDAYRDPPAKHWCAEAQTMSSR